MASLLACHPYAAACLFLVLFNLCKRLILLWRNVKRARKTGLPYSIYFHHRHSWLWNLASALSITHRLFDLPRTQEWRDYWNDTTYATRWRVGSGRAERIGRVYLMVHPDVMVCMVADAETISMVVRERDVFQKPVHAYAPLKLFGKNLVASEGAEWHHHHRHTAPAFNKKTYAIVWHESLSQAEQLIFSLCSSTGPLKIQHPKHSFMRLALHVLSAVGFGNPISFSSETRHDSTTIPLLDEAVVPDGYTNTWTETINFITFHNVRHFFLIHALGSLIRNVPPCLLPKVVRKHQAAHADFTNYTTAMIANSRANGANGRNLLDMMVASTEAEKVKGGRHAGLSDAEIMGNIFIFVIAGHETTAGTLSFAFVVMAAEKNVQQWVREGVDSALESVGDDFTEWEYEQIYPKLTRVLCLMFETLRFFSSVVSIPKHCGDNTPLVYDGKTYLLPAMHLSLNQGALNMNPRYWGEDAQEFKPERWLNEDETVKKPAKGTFIAFSDGVRSCIGRGFAETEFCAVVCKVLRAWNVEVGEGGREKAWKVLRGSTAGLVLNMNEPIELLLEKRR